MALKGLLLGPEESSLQLLEDLVYSHEWRAFVAILDQCKVDLQRGSNSLLRAHEDRRASEILAKIDILNKIEVIIMDKLEENKKAKMP